MTRKHLPVVVLLAAIFSLTALAQTGAAAAPAAAPAAAAPIKVGTIMFPWALLATNEWQRDFQQLQTRFDPKQTELKNLNDEVDRLRNQLQTQGDKLNDQARADLVKNIEAKQKTLQRNAEDFQAEAQREQNELFGRLAPKFLKTLETYAKNNGFAMILKYDPEDQGSPLLWWVPNADVTREVVDAYNKESGVPAPPRPAGATGAQGAPARPATTPAKPAATTPAKPAPPTKQ